MNSLSLSLSLRSSQVTSSPPIRQPLYRLIRMLPAPFSTFGLSSTKYRRLRCAAKKKAANLLPPSYGRATTFLNFLPTVLFFFSSLRRLILPVPRLTPAIFSEYDRFPWARVVIPRELLDSVWSTGRSYPFHRYSLLCLLRSSFFPLYPSLRIEKLDSRGTKRCNPHSRTNGIVGSATFGNELAYRITKHPAVDGANNTRAR